jgi:hypothetical protein
VVGAATLPAADNATAPRTARAYPPSLRNTTATSSCRCGLSSIANTAFNCLPVAVLIAASCLCCGLLQCGGCSVMPAVLMPLAHCGVFVFLRPTTGLLSAMHWSQARTMLTRTSCLIGRMCCRCVRCLRVNITFLLCGCSLMAVERYAWVDALTLRNLCSQSIQVLTKLCHVHI